MLRSTALLRYVAVMASKTRLSLPFDGKRLRHQRESRGLTLAALSKRCEELGETTDPPVTASASTIHRWETGEFTPSPPRLALLAKALGVDTDDLCDSQEEIGGRVITR